MTKIKAVYDFQAWRERTEKHYEVDFPNIQAEERRKLIDRAEKVLRQKYTPEWRYV